MRTRSPRWPRSGRGQSRRRLLDLTDLEEALLEEADHGDLAELDAIGYLPPAHHVERQPRHVDTAGDGQRQGPWCPRIDFEQGRPARPVPAALDVGDIGKAGPLDDRRPELLKLAIADGPAGHGD